MEGNPDLDPERSLTTEVGWKFARGHDQAALSLFRTDLRDLIQVQYIDVNGDGQITAARPRAFDQR